MEALITIKEQNGSKVCSARELHKFLEVETPFRKWIERMFEYGFVENQDYTRVDKNVRQVSGTKKMKEYALTLDTAKEISMLQRNDKGKQARQYFIEIERQQNKPMDILDVMANSIQMMKDNKAKLSEFDKRLLRIEAKTTTRPDYFTIAGYATLNGIKCGLKLASSLGRKASKICKDSGVATETIPDPRFGIVKTYPTDILEQVFETSLVS